MVGGNREGRWVVVVVQVLYQCPIDSPFVQFTNLVSRCVCRQDLPVLFISGMSSVPHK